MFGIIEDDDISNALTESQARKISNELHHSGEIKKYCEILLDKCFVSDLQKFFEEKFSQARDAKSFKEIGLVIFNISQSSKNRDQEKQFPRLCDLMKIESQLSHACLKQVLTNFKYDFNEQLKICCTQRINQQMESYKKYLSESAKKIEQCNESLRQHQAQLDILSKENIRGEFEKYLKLILGSERVIKSNETKEVFRRITSIKNLTDYLRKFNSTPVPQLISLCNAVEKIYDKESLKNLLAIIHDELQDPIPKINKDCESVYEITGKHIDIAAVVKKYSADWKKDNIKSVRILARGTIYLNEKEIDCHEKNLTLIAPTINVSCPTTIDVSGKKKDPAFLLGSSAQSGKSRRAFDHTPSGLAGLKGADGIDGGNAGDIYIETINLISPLNLTLKLNGGNGSPGQNGGDGDDGVDGVDGTAGQAKDGSVRFFCKGFDFQKEEGRAPGEKGGDGGSGGSGGAGGMKGNLTIKVKDKAYTVDDSNNNITIDCKIERENGNDGKPGDGGNGGKGGKNGKEAVDEGYAWRGIPLYKRVDHARGRLIKHDINTSILSLTPPVWFEKIRTEEDIKKTVQTNAVNGKKGEQGTVNQIKARTAIQMQNKSEIMALQQDNDASVNELTKRNNAIASLKNKIEEKTKQQSILQEHHLQIIKQIASLEALQERLNKVAENSDQQLSQHQLSQKTISHTVSSYEERAHDNHVGISPKISYWKGGANKLITTRLHINEIKKILLEEIETKGGLFSNWFGSKKIHITLEEKLVCLWDYLFNVKQLTEQDANHILELIESVLLLSKKANPHNLLLEEKIKKALEHLNLNNSETIKIELIAIIKEYYMTEQLNFKLVKIIGYLLNDKELTSEQNTLVENNKKDLYEVVKNICSELDPMSAVTLLEKAVSTNEKSLPNNRLSKIIHDYSATFYRFSKEIPIPNLHNLLRDKKKQLEVIERREIKPYELRDVTLYRHFFNGEYKVRECLFEESINVFNITRSSKNQVDVLRAFVHVLSESLAVGKHIYRLCNKNGDNFISEFFQNILAYPHTEIELVELEKINSQLIDLCHKMPMLCQTFYGQTLLMQYSVKQQLKSCIENDNLVRSLINAVGTRVKIASETISHIKEHLLRVDKENNFDGKKIKNEFINKLIKCYSDNPSFVDLVLNKNELIKEPSAKTFLEALRRKNNDQANSLSEMINQFDEKIKNQHIDASKYFVEIIEYISTHKYEICDLVGYMPFMKLLLSYFEFLAQTPKQLETIMSVTYSQECKEIQKKYHNTNKSDRNNLQSLYHFYMLGKEKLKDNVLSLVLNSKDEYLKETLENYLEEIDNVVNQSDIKDGCTTVFIYYGFAEDLCKKYAEQKLDDEEMQYHLQNMAEDIRLVSLIEGSINVAEISKLILCFRDHFGDKNLRILLFQLRTDQIDWEFAEKLMKHLADAYKAISENGNEDLINAIKDIQEIINFKVRRMCESLCCDNLKSLVDNKVEYNNDIKDQARKFMDYIDTINDSSSKLDIGSYRFHKYVKLQDTFGEYNRNSLLTNHAKNNPISFSDAYLFELNEIKWSPSQAFIDVFATEVSRITEEKDCAISEIRLSSFISNMNVDVNVFDQLVLSIQNSSLGYSMIKKFLSLIYQKYEQQVLSDKINIINIEVEKIVEKDDNKNPSSFAEDKMKVCTEILEMLLSNKKYLNFQDHCKYLNQFAGLLEKNSNDLLDFMVIKKSMNSDMDILHPIASCQKLNKLIIEYNNKKCVEALEACINECIRAMLIVKACDLWALSVTIRKLINQLHSYKYKVDCIDRIRSCCMLLCADNIKNAKNVEHVIEIKNELLSSIDQVYEKNLINAINQKEQDYEAIITAVNQDKQPVLEKLRLAINDAHEEFGQNDALIAIYANFEKMEHLLALFNLDQDGSIRKKMYIQIQDFYETEKMAIRFSLKKCITNIENKVVELCVNRCLKAVIAKLDFSDNNDQQLNKLCEAYKVDYKYSSLIQLFKEFYNSQVKSPSWHKNLAILAGIFKTIFKTSQADYRNDATELYKFLEADTKISFNRPGISKEDIGYLREINASLSLLMTQTIDADLEIIQQTNNDFEESIRSKIQICHNTVTELLKINLNRCSQLEQIIKKPFPIGPLLDAFEKNIFSRIKELKENEIEQLTKEIINDHINKYLSNNIAQIEESQRIKPKTSQFHSKITFGNLCQIAKQLCQFINSNTELSFSQNYIWSFSQLEFISSNISMIGKSQTVDQLNALMDILLDALDVILNQKNSCENIGHFLPRFTYLIFKIFITISENLAQCYQNNESKKAIVIDFVQKATSIISYYPDINLGFKAAKELIKDGVKLISNSDIGIDDVKGIDNLEAQLNRNIKSNLLSSLSHSIPSLLGKNNVDTICGLLTLIYNQMTKEDQNSKIELNKIIPLVLQCITLSVFDKKEIHAILPLFEKVYLAIQIDSSSSGLSYVLTPQHQTLFKEVSKFLKDKLYEFHEPELLNHERTLFKRVLNINCHNLSYDSPDLLALETNKDESKNRVLHYLVTNEAKMYAENSGDSSTIYMHYEKLLQEPSEAKFEIFKQRLITFYSAFITDSEKDYLLQILESISKPAELNEVFAIFEVSSAHIWQHHLKQMALNLTYKAILQSTFRDIEQIETSVNKIVSAAPKINGSAELLTPSFTKALNKLMYYYDYSEYDAKYLLSTIDKLLDINSKNNIVQQKILKIKSSVQQLINFSYQYNRAFFFANEGKYAAEVFQLIDVFLEKQSNTYHCQEKMQDMFSFFADILAECGDKESVSKITELLNDTRVKNWKDKIIFGKLKEVIIQFIGNPDNQPNLKIVLDTLLLSVEKVRSNLSLIKVLSAKITQENRLVESTSKISTHELIEIFKLLEIITLDKQMLLILNTKSLSQWKGQLRTYYINQKLPPADETNLETKQQCVVQLSRLEKRFGAALITKLLDIIKKPTNYQILHSILDRFVRGSFIFDEDALNSIENDDMQEWHAKIEQYTKDKQKKPRDLSELLKLLKLEFDNDSNGNKINYDQVTSHLTAEVNNTKAALEQSAPLINFTKKPVRAWTKETILEWRDYIKKNCNREWIIQHLPHVVAVVCHAVKLNYIEQLKDKNRKIQPNEYYPHDTQLLALWLFLDESEKNKGRLGQVSTGEGKTVITAMLAIIKALSGEKVDVVTSSSVLAERDSKANKSLFSYFNLTVDNNCDEPCQKNVDVRHSRYQSDVVYGDVGSFQRDILLTSFLNENVLGDRKCNSLIIDEVDSMLIDKSENMLYLSHEIKDLRHLRYFYIKIWSLVNAPDADSYTEFEAINKISIEIKHAIETKELLVPSCLEEFIDNRIRTWIKSAFQAKRMKENISYVITAQHNEQKKQKIIVMDNDTGVEQLQMQWCNGLHQFLQLKHTLELTDESLKAVFKSNYNYFTQANKIYGLTGTLGSLADRELLKKMYKIDFFQLPRNKAYKFVEETGIVCTEEHTPSVNNKNNNTPVKDSPKGWFESIEEDIIQKTQGKNPRAVLIICENVEKVDQLVEHLKKTRPGLSPHVYKSAYSEFKVGQSDTKLKPGEIIIATNLAGRGTDLHTSDSVEKNGGLHVILSYLPPNIRVEEQAFGRTARQGNKGSGKFIIYNKDNKLTLDQLKEIRDEHEQNNIDKIRLNNLQAISAQETLFKNFTDFYNEIRTTLSLKCQNKNDKKYIELQLKSLKDHWAFWLDSISEKIKDVTKYNFNIILNEFVLFKKQMNALLEHDNVTQLITSNHELIKLGVYYISENNRINALKCFSQVIERDENFSEIAHYFKAYCVALDKKANKADINHEMSKNLKQAKKLIKMRIHESLTSNEVVRMIALFRQTRGQGISHNQYEEQVKNESKLYNIHLRAIDEAIGRDIEPDTFAGGKITEEQSKQIYNLIREKSKILKDFRVCKKVSYKDKTLYLTENGKQIAVNIPHEYLYCQQKIIDLISKKLITHQAIQASRVINEDDFKSIVASQESLWNRLVDTQLLQVSQDQIYFLSFQEKELLTLDLSCFGDNELQIQEVLKSNKHKVLNRSWFPKLNNDLFQALSNLLIKQKLIKIIPQGVLTVEYDPDNKMIKLPKSLETFNEIIYSAVKSKITPDTKETKIAINITREDISLPETDELATQVIWHHFINQNVIKLCRTNFSSEFAKNKDIVDKRIEEIGEQLKIVLKEIFKENKPVDRKTLPLANSKNVVAQKLCDIQEKVTNTLTDVFVDPADEYVGPILEILRGSIGKIKTIPDPNVNFQNIEQFFMKGDYPPEIEEFIKIIFEQVISLEEKPCYWNWNCFFIAMFGLAQIIAGVVLDVFTMGAATPLCNILIGEGVGDIIFAIQAGLTNNFRWKDYAIHKAISLTCSVLTLGIGGLSGPIIEDGIKFADFSISLLKTASFRIVQESAKGVVLSLANLAIEKLFEDFPHELNIYFGEQLRKRVNNSEKFKTTSTELKQTLAALLSLSQDSQTIKSEIEIEFADILNQSVAAERSLIMQYICALPEFAFCAGEHYLKNKIGGVAGLIEEVMRLTLQCTSAVKKYYELLDQLVNNFDALNKKLKAKVDALKAQKVAIKPSTTKDEAYIDNLVSSQQDHVIKRMCSMLNDEIVKPAMNRHLNHALNSLNDCIGKAIQKAMVDDNANNNKSRRKKVANMLKESEQQTVGTFQENQEVQTQATKNNQALSQVSTDIVVSENVDPTTQISNADMSLGELINAAGKDNIKALYKDANGGTAAEQSSFKNLIEGGDQQQIIKRDKHKSHKRNKHNGKNGHHGSESGHSSNHGDAREHGHRGRGHGRGHGHHGHGQGHHGRGHGHHGHGHGHHGHGHGHHGHGHGHHGHGHGHHGHGHGHHGRGYGHHGHGHGHHGRSHGHHGHPHGHYGHGRNHGGHGGHHHHHGVSGRGMRASRVHHSSSSSLFYINKTVQIACFIVKGTTLMVQENMERYYQHRIKSIEIAILKERLNSHKKLKKIHEEKNKKCTELNEKYKTDELDFIEKQLNDEIAKKESEIATMEIKIKMSFLEKINLLKDDASDINETYTSVKNEIDSIKAINSNIACGSANIANIIISALSEYEKSFVTTKPPKIEALQEITKELNVVIKKQSELEEQLKIVKIAHEFAVNKNIPELQDHILRNEISIDVEELAEANQTAVNDSYYVAFDMPNNILDASSFYEAPHSGINYQMSELFNSHPNMITNFGNIIEVVSKVAMTRGKSDIGKNNITAKENYLAAEKIKGNAAIQVGQMEADIEVSKLVNRNTQRAEDIGVISKGSAQMVEVSKKREALNKTIYEDKASHQNERAVDKKAQLKPFMKKLNAQAQSPGLFSQKGTTAANESFFSNQSNPELNQDDEQKSKHKPTLNGQFKMN